MSSWDLVQPNLPTSYHFSLSIPVTYSVVSGDVAMPFEFPLRSLQIIVQQLINLQDFVNVQSIYFVLTLLNHNSSQDCIK